ncbi:unnamed protein product [Phyllotreta striolata]|uniref:Phospholipase A2 n=1 Tax=Phyllotreta striolata TaxID=444603 RepID=A0A9N9TNL6_PHYSR|nr:unnamed protein product [Phyllotreta striolata]
MTFRKGCDAAMFALLFVLCVIGTSGKPSFPFSFSAISSFGQQQTDPPVLLKSYSGRRVDKNSLRMVYFHDQTVAVVELGPNKLLLNCEFIEIIEQNQVFEVLGELKAKARPVAITFMEMITLMNQCKQLEDRREKMKSEQSKNNTMTTNEGRKLSNPFTLFSGIVPGTKWCGTGDIAKDYYDLGEDKMVDVCCRAHDLCPVKIRAYTKKYSLMNNSLYTKSHCKCDDDLFNCLRLANYSKTAQIMGNIYFNLVQVPCLEDGKEGRQFRKARTNF